MKALLTAAALAVTLGASQASAAIIDFTSISYINSLTGTPLQGSAGYANYTLTATNGAINFKDQVNGTACSAAGILACQRDGLGITDDEISAGATVSTGETLTLTFDKKVRIDTMFFLDLFDKSASGKGREQARVSFDGATPLEFNALLNGNGGYLASNADLPIMAKELVFSAAPGALFQDDGSNDYAVAGLEITVMPVPASLPLLLAGLGGMAFLRGRRSA